MESSRLQRAMRTHRFQLCARWLLDKMRLPLHAWGAMAMAVCVGMAITYWENVGEFSRFQSSLIVHSMPESYVVGWADFFRLLLMPKTLVGGMWGLYLATAILVVYAAASAPLRKTPPAAQRCYE